jgi:hypothetical protein
MKKDTIASQTQYIFMEFGWLLRFEIMEEIYKTAEYVIQSFNRGNFLLSITN